MTEHDWAAWLRDWNRELLERFDPGEPDAFVDPAVIPDVVASGWLGSAGATEAELAALESRLGTSLPPSYRSFLRASNGFFQPGVIVPRLLPADEVDWYRVRHQETIDAWNLGAGESVGEPGAFEQYLSTALQVSAVERVGSAVYLLNPRVVDHSGEWEALYFANWVPGADRYPSFRALMDAERERFTSPEPPPRPRSRWRTSWDLLRWIFRMPP